MILRRENCRAGRALLGWSARDLADASGLSLATINSFESGRTIDLTAANQKAVIEALEQAGVKVLPENGEGQGVRFAANSPDPKRRPKGKPGPKRKAEEVSE